MNIKVMTFNIHHGKGVDKKLDLNRIGQIISQSEADIIGLNEVDKHFSKRSDFIDQVQFLANHLNLHFAFSPSLTSKSKKGNLLHQYGNGLLSRFPLMKSNCHAFNLLPWITEDRSILEATINVNQKILNIYVTHLSLNYLLHKKQSDFILNNINKPAIILGDWNMKPRSRKWKRIAERYCDVWHEVGNDTGFTYPSTKPRNRLDYIFISEDLQILDARVIKSIPSASDHLPVISTLSI